MRRLALIVVLLVAAAGGLVAASAGADDTRTYEIEMYNAFGIVDQSDVRIAGVNAGSVSDLDITPDKTAIVTVELSGDLGTLGEDTTCSTEPQSLIAEYFISCDPAGPPLEEDDDADNPDPDIPAEQVEQTVQNDLVLNTLREPFKRRFQLLINEFGTALAGNSERLNTAIRLGAPALTELRKVTKILASQNTIIRDLQVDSDTVIGELAANREDVVRFVEEARDTAEASAARRDDLSRDFELLDDFLAELQPTLADLETVAREQTPLLTDLRGAAPGLNTLAVNLPPFNRSTEAALDALGGASAVGETALRRGADEIEQLAESGKRAPVTAEMLADLFRDLDDPRRAVEIDDRVAEVTKRRNETGGKKDTKGYTGLEGLLNYVHYQSGALNQYDQLGHSLHFTLYSIFTGPCGSFSSGHNEENGNPGVPAANTENGATTTNILEAARCIGWLGPNQPGINEALNLPPYDPSVCPNGTSPAAAEALCKSTTPSRKHAESGGGGAEDGRGGGEGAAEGAGPNTGEETGGGAPGEPPAPPVDPDGPLPDDLLEGLLDVPQSALEDLPQNLQNSLLQLGNGLQRGPGTSAPSAPSTGAAAEDLLEFLFTN